jgi:hypothetical protein
MEGLDCMAEDRVLSEPLSDAISLLTGKNTGKMRSFFPKVDAENPTIV